jgi:hypothetical protein
MPESPLEFWDSLTLNQILTWGFAIFACFVLFLYIMERAEEKAQRAEKRRR